MLDRELRHRRSRTKEEAPGRDQESICMSLLHQREGRGQFLLVLHSDRVLDPQAQRAARVCQRGAPAAAIDFQIEIPKYGDAGDAGNRSLEHLELLLKRSASA
jgi:hypothetical protein